MALDETTIVTSWPPYSLDDPEAGAEKQYEGVPRNIAYIDNLKPDPELQPKKYEIAGTHPDSRILFKNVNILDSTGKEPYLGSVLIEGERITHVGEVPKVAELEKDPKVRVFNGKGRTLMSGLGDGHTHLSWNGGDLVRLGEMHVEEHVLLTARSAQCYLDSGYTMCFGAASAKDRLDVVVRDAINAGDIPGPRTLANAREIAKPEGELIAGITAFADGPEEMREVIRRSIEEIGADNIKLSMSGDDVAEDRPAQECYFTDEETAACVDEAHKRKKRLCSHARARESVIMCVKHGVEVIYHASYIDDEGMKLLEEKKDKHFVVPAINFPWATVFEAEALGYSQLKAHAVGIKHEVEMAVAALREMHRRGIVVLPGGDYGFNLTPHGTYARDLKHFVDLIGMTEHESIIAATAGVAALMMRGDELGKIQPGYYGDVILVNGDPLQDISVLQDHDKLDIIIINGRVHKAGRKEYITDAPSGVAAAQRLNAEFPEIKAAMQKAY